MNQTIKILANHQLLGIVGIVAFGCVVACGVPADSDEALRAAYAGQNSSGQHEQGRDDKRNQNRTTFGDKRALADQRLRDLVALNAAQASAAQAEAKLLKFIPGAASNEDLFRQGMGYMEVSLADPDRPTKEHLAAFLAVYRTMREAVRSLPEPWKQVGDDAAGWTTDWQIDQVRDQIILGATPDYLGDPPTLYLINGRVTGVDHSNPDTADAAMKVLIVQTTDGEKRIPSIGFTFRVLDE